MRFDDAIKAHSAWKLKIQQLNDGTSTEAPPDPARVARTDQCDLGRWINGEARQKYGTDPDFQRLAGMHAEFHREAAILIRQILSGQKLTDDDIHVSRYARLSMRIIGQLLTMKRRYDVGTVGRPLTRAAGEP